MADTRHPADALADCAPYVRSEEAKHWRDDAQEWLRRIPALEAERDQLRAEVEALRADAERLDFIEKHTDMQLRFRKKRWSMRGFTNYEFDVFLTAREAIDAARKQQ